MCFTNFLGISEPSQVDSHHNHHRNVGEIVGKDNEFCFGDTESEVPIIDPSGYFP